MIALTLLSIAALVAIHMRKPSVKRVTLSSARFFKDLPQPRADNRRMSFSNPFSSPAFYLRLMVLMLAAAALFSGEMKLWRKGNERTGMAFLIDTSASMSVPDGHGDRMDAARAEVEKILARIGESEEPAVQCFRLSGFDLARSDWGDDLAVDELSQKLKEIEHRPLGTDAGLAKRFLALLGEEEDAGCRISALTVVSDQPAPAWLESGGPVEIAWRQIGTAAYNAGFADISASRNPLTGAVRSVAVSMRRYGKPPPGEIPSLEIQSPSGETILSKPIAFDFRNNAFETFSPTSPGIWRLKIRGGGSYLYDDLAALAVPESGPLKVHWEPQDDSLPKGLGWMLDESDPPLAVRFGPPDDSPAPTLFLGGGYSNPGPGTTPIALFRESSPLLEDLHFDVAETAGIAGIPLPDGFAYDMTAADLEIWAGGKNIVPDGKTWIARRRNPPAVLIPGLPTGRDDNLGRFSATLFFNSVKWLLANRRWPPLYTLTSPNDREISGNRIALHPGEGDTAPQVRQFGEPATDGSHFPNRPKQPLWPAFLAAASAFFALERTLTVLGGSRWN